MGDTIEQIMQIIDNELDHEPCGCPECSYGVQPGHARCEVPREKILRLEARGMIVRDYVDGRWRWLQVDS